MVINNKFLYFIQYKNYHNNNLIIKKITEKKVSMILINEEMYNSTLGLKVSQKVRDSIYFSYNSMIFSQIIGHLLGDGNLSMFWSSKNPYFIFTQGFL